MKAANFVFLGVVLFAIVLFVSATAEAAQDIKPKDTGEGHTEYGAELPKIPSFPWHWPKPKPKPKTHASIFCEHGCCDGKKWHKPCNCCASAEEAKVATKTLKHVGLSGNTAGEANP